MKTFTAQLKDIAALRKQDLLQVASEAIQDVMEAAQTPQIGITKGATGFVEGKIPVAEAELINSLTVEGKEGKDSYVLAIADMEIGDYLRFTWTAPHAMRMEMGFTGTDKAGRTYEQPGRHFVGANARRFSDFVEARAKEVKR